MLVAPSLPADQRRLLSLYSGLEPEAKAQLIDFAQFLVDRAGNTKTMPMPVAPPASIVRPQQESVVAAMKRLRATYHMLDTTPILDQAAVLMSAHLLRGEPAETVIDQLQIIFEQSYSRLLED